MSNRQHSRIMRKGSYIGWIVVSAVMLCGLMLSANAQVKLVMPNDQHPQKPTGQALKSERSTPGLDKKIIRAIKKSIKESERELVVHRNLEGFLEAYTAKFEYIFGRSPMDLSHDYRLDEKAFMRRIRQIWKVPAGHTADVFFPMMRVQADGENILVETTVRHILFGLQKSEGRIYRLQNVGDIWKVSQVRVWPINDDLGGQLSQYNSKFWKNADRDVKSSAEKKSTLFVHHLTLLLRAHQIRAAYQFARQTTEKRPKFAEAWKARGALAHQLGQTEEAEMCAKRARKLDPNMDIPSILR